MVKIGYQRVRAGDVEENLEFFGVGVDVLLEEEREVEAAIACVPGPEVSDLLLVQPDELLLRAGDERRGRVPVRVEVKEKAQALGLDA